MIVLLLFLFFAFPITAQEPLPSIVINEFAIEPIQKVELWNVTDDLIDISGWYIDDNGGTTFFTIPQETLIYPHACRVIEGSFNLNKSSADSIRLFNNSTPPTDQQAVLIDQYDYPKSPGSNISYARSPDGENQWIENVSSFGFSNTTGEACELLPTPSPTPTLTPSPTKTPTPQPTNEPVSYDHLFISEAMVAPLAGSQEWIELYNDNDFEVTLSDWYIDDIADGGSSPKKISLTIPSKNYKTVELSSALFNNSGDSVRLLNPEEEEQAIFMYEYSEKGYTWGWPEMNELMFCIQNPSPDAVNSGCVEAISDTLTQDTSAQTLSSPVQTSKPIQSSSQATKQSRVLLHYRIVVTPPAFQTNNQQKPTGTVLGTMIDNKAQEKANLNLPLLSLSYSLLSISSLVVKMVVSRVT